MSVISITPITSEKAYDLSLQHVYVFAVPLSANKQHVKENVESQYGVRVTAVRSVVQAGKPKNYSKGKRSRPGVRQRSDSKKAYVRLAEGDSITIFEDKKTDEKEKK